MRKGAIRKEICLKAFKDIKKGMMCNINTRLFRATPLTGKLKAPDYLYAVASNNVKKGELGWFYYEGEGIPLLTKIGK
jgi:hypothetical protein